LITLLIALAFVGSPVMWSHSSLPPPFLPWTHLRESLRSYTVQIPTFGTYAFSPNHLVSLPRVSWVAGWNPFDSLAHRVVHPSWYSRKGNTMPSTTLRVHPWIWTLRTPLLNMTLFDNKGPNNNVGKRCHDLWVLCNLYRTPCPRNLFAGQTWLVDELFQITIFLWLCQFAQALLKLDLQDEKCISLYRLARRSHL
jgi:hypothetical protein